MATTIGNLITQKKAADQAAVQAKAALDAAQLAYTQALATAVDASSQLKTGLAQTGTAFVQDPNGAVEVYLPDQTDTGYSVITPVADATAVDLTPPASAPTPEPAPIPARDTTPEPVPVPAR